MALQTPTALDSTFTQATATNTATSGSFTATIDTMLLVAIVATDDAATIGAVTMTSTHAGIDDNDWAGLEAEMVGGSERMMATLYWVNPTSTGSGTVTVTLGTTVDRFHIRPLQITSDDPAKRPTHTGGGEIADATAAGSASFTLSSAPATSSYVIGCIGSWNEGGDITAGATYTELFEMFAGTIGEDRINSQIQYRTSSTSTTLDWGGLNTIANSGVGYEILEEDAPAGEAPGYTTENLYGATGPSASNTGVDSTGTYWSAKTRGLCTGGRYYKQAATPTGAGTMKLWSGAGSELASAGFTIGAGDPNNAWYEVLFSTPIEITPFTQYVISVSYFSSFYHVTIPFAPQTISGNIRDMSSQYNATANLFPNTDVGNKYWIDVLFLAGPISCNRWG